MPPTRDSDVEVIAGRSAQLRDVSDLVDDLWKVASATWSVKL
jgi:hypothetical protein